MPYTATQLNTYYQSLTGTAPVGADAILISASAAQSQNGTQSDTNTLLTVFNSAGVQGTFEVVESTYQFFTNSGVSQAGLAFLEGNAGSGNANGLNTAFYAGFNTENRYYNFAINLASAGGAGNANFVSSYGSLTFAQTVASAYETIIGASNVGTAAANAAIADITSRQAFFTSVAQQRAGGVDAGGAAGLNIALKAIVVGYILEEANKADVGTYAKAIDQLEASVAAVGSGANISSPFSSNIVTTFGASGSGFNSGFAALGASTSSQTNFSLTTGIDTFQPTTGSIQFVGVVNQGTGAGQGGNANTSFNPSTLQAGDQVRGTGANNTLTIDTVGNVNDATGGATVSGIQTINIRAVADPQGAAGATGTAALNASFVPGATAINAFQSRGAVTLTMVAGSTSVGITNDGVTTGASLAATYVDSATTATLNFAGGTTAGTTANVAGAGLVTANVNSNGGLNTLTTLTLANTVTTLNLAATSALTITNGIADTGLRTLRASGSNPINIGTVNATNLTAIDTTGLTSTGALTATFTNAPTAAATYALGMGSDNLTFGTAAAPVTLTNANINLGGGTNSLTVTGGLTGSTITGGTATDIVTIVGAIDATSVINTSGGGDLVQIDTTIGGAATTAQGASINGGGSATLVTDAANFTAISTTFSAANRAKVTGFSTVGIDDALANGATYDVNAIGAQNFTTVGVAANGNATLNANSGAVVTFVDNLGGFGGNGIATNTGVLNIALANSAANTNDVLNLGYSAQGTTATSTVTTANVETVNITANRAAGNTTAVLTVALTDAAAVTENLFGNEAIVFRAAATSTALTTVNGSGLTAATGVVLDVAAVTGRGGVVGTASAATPFTLIGGSGADTLGFQDYTRVTGGAGNDILHPNITTSGQSYSSFVDASAGDTIVFSTTTATYTANATGTVNTTKITLNSTAVFQDYLDAATGSAHNTQYEVTAFDFGGDTYLVQNTVANGAVTYQNGQDAVIRLVGIHAIAATSGAGVVVLGS